jgi:hypothetical protein
MWVPCNASVPILTGLAYSNSAHATWLGIPSTTAVTCRIMPRKAGTLKNNWHDSIHHGHWLT